MENFCFFEFPIEIFYLAKIILCGLLNQQSGLTAPCTFSLTAVLGTILTQRVQIAIHFILDDNDLEHSTSSALLSWEYLNYFSSKPVTPVTVTDGLQFGDKLGATQTSDITTSPPQPQPVFHPEPSDFHVYGVSETTESGKEMKPEFLGRIWIQL